MRIKKICAALICAIGIATSGCSSEEGKAVAKDEIMSQNCNVSFRLAKVNLGQRGRANRMPPPYTMTQVARSLDDFSGSPNTYVSAVTKEAEKLAKSTFCELIEGKNLLVDLTFISADSLRPTEAELLKLPRHGFADFDSGTGVLRAVFVRSYVQTLADIYTLETGDESEPRGYPHTDSFPQQIYNYLDNPSENTTNLITWLVEHVSHISDQDEKREAIFAKIDTMMQQDVEEAYIAAARTFLKNAAPNKGFVGGYGFNNLVGPEIAKKYRRQK